MWAIKEAPQTAPDFIQYLENIYGRSAVNNHTLDDLNDVVNLWKRQGIPLSIDTAKMEADPQRIYRAYFDDILQACDLNDIATDCIFFTLIDIKNLNAYASTLPNKDRVIVLDENLVSFFTCFFIASLVAVYSKPSAHQSDQLEAFLFDTLAHFANPQHSVQQKKDYASRFKKIIQVDYRLTEIGCYLSIACTLFILCHELSHHLLGHTENRCLSPNSAEDQRIAQMLNTPNHNEEFAADHYGYDLFLSLIENVEQVQFAKLSHAFNRTPLLFFEVIEIVHNIQPKKESALQQKDTHPPPMKRKSQLLSHYQHQLHGDGEALYDDLMPFIRYLNDHCTNINS
ncbi:MAG: hypothetical protein KAG28_01795 [Cocleimonas sp.]|nr:hypothetical protein [Cocleimonas sp.]